jgi:endonuclease/exonuclease/phosphatase family metal-dependent hydrolase
VPGWNVAQLRRIVKHLASTPGPTIIMGDFNLPAGVPARVTGYHPMVSHRSFPATRPLMQLDHMLLRGKLGDVQHTQALRLPLSDHRALVVDIATTT